MDKAEIIKLLQSEDWTKADALRAVESIDFSANPDELSIRRKMSRQFIGSELIKRQREQATQKGLLTRKTNQFDLSQQQYQIDTKQLNLKIELLKQQVKELDLSEQMQKINLIDRLTKEVKELNTNNQSLIKVNGELKKDNKNLKNIVDAIRLRIATDMKEILKYSDRDLRQAILKLFKSTQG